MDIALLLLGNALELGILYFLYKLWKAQLAKAERNWQPAAPHLDQQQMIWLADALAERLRSSQPDPAEPTTALTQGEQTESTSPLRLRAYERDESYRQAKAWGMNTGQWWIVQETKIEAQQTTMKRGVAKRDDDPITVV